MSRVWNGDKIIVNPNKKSSQLNTDNDNSYLFAKPAKNANTINGWTLNPDNFAEQSNECTDEDLAEQKAGYLNYYIRKLHNLIAIQELMFNDKTDQGNVGNVLQLLFDSGYFCYPELKTDSERKIIVSEMVNEYRQNYHQVMVCWRSDDTWKLEKKAQMDFGSTQAFQDMEVSADWAARMRCVRLKITNNNQKKTEYKDLLACSVHLPNHDKGQDKKIVYAAFVKGIGQLAHACHNPPARYLFMGDWNRGGLGELDKMAGKRSTPNVPVHFEPRGDAIDRVFSNVRFLGKPQIPMEGQPKWRNAHQRVEFSFFPGTMSKKAVSKKAVSKKAVSKKSEEGAKKPVQHKWSKYQCDPEQFQQLGEHTDGFDFILLQYKIKHESDVLARPMFQEKPTFSKEESVIYKFAYPQHYVQYRLRYLQSKQRDHGLNCLEEGELQQLTKIAFTLEKTESNRWNDKLEAFIFEIHIHIQDTKQNAEPIRVKCDWDIFTKPFNWVDGDEKFYTGMLPKWTEDVATNNGNDVVTNNDNNDVDIKDENKGEEVEKILLSFDLTAEEVWRRRSFNRLLALHHTLDDDCKTFEASRLYSNKGNREQYLKDAGELVGDDTEAGLQKKYEALDALYRLHLEIEMTRLETNYLEMAAYGDIKLRTADCLRQAEDQMFARSGNLKIELLLPNTRYTLFHQLDKSAHSIPRLYIQECDHDMNSIRNAAKEYMTTTYSEQDKVFSLRIDVGTVDKVANVRTNAFDKWLVPSLRREIRNMWKVNQASVTLTLVPTVEDAKAWFTKNQPLANQNEPLILWPESADDDASNKYIVYPKKITLSKTIEYDANIAPACEKNGNVHKFVKEYDQVQIAQLISDYRVLTRSKNKKNQNNDAISNYKGQLSVLSIVLETKQAHGIPQRCFLLRFIKILLANESEMTYFDLDVKFSPSEITQFASRIKSQKIGIIVTLDMNEEVQTNAKIQYVNSAPVLYEQFNSHTHDWNTHQLESETQQVLMGMRYDLHVLQVIGIFIGVILLTGLALQCFNAALNLVKSFPERSERSRSKPLSFEDDHGDCPSMV